LRKLCPIPSRSHWNRLKPSHQWQEGPTKDDFATSQRDRQWRHRQSQSVDWLWNVMALTSQPLGLTSSLFVFQVRREHLLERPTIPEGQRLCTRQVSITNQDSKFLLWRVRIAKKLIAELCQGA
jgi:hypothetical protein